MAAPPGRALGTAPPPKGNKGGDPVDLCTGLFVLEKTDLVANDVVPVALEIWRLMAWSFTTGMNVTSLAD